MAKSSKILSKLGITDVQQYRLYSYDLIDALISVNGIGEHRLEKLQTQLAAQYDDARIPMSSNWVYRLVLNVMQEPIKAQNLCEIRKNGRSLLEQMRDVTPEDVSRVNALLKDALRPQEQHIVIRIYRNRDNLWNLAHEFGCDVAHIRRIKNRAINKLREPAFTESLKKIIFIDDSDDETGND